MGEAAARRTVEQVIGAGSPSAPRGEPGTVVLGRALGGYNWGPSSVEALLHAGLPPVRRGRRGLPEEAQGR